MVIAINIKGKGKEHEPKILPFRQPSPVDVIFGNRHLLPPGFIFPTINGERALMFRPENGLYPTLDIFKTSPEEFFMDQPSVCLAQNGPILDGHQTLTITKFNLDGTTQCKTILAPSISSTHARYDLEQALNSSFQIDFIPPQNNAQTFQLAVMVAEALSKDMFQSPYSLQSQRIIYEHIYRHFPISPVVQVQPYPPSENEIKLDFHRLATEAEINALKNNGTFDPHHIISHTLHIQKIKHYPNGWKNDSEDIVRLAMDFKDTGCTLIFESRNDEPTTIHMSFPDGSSFSPKNDIADRLAKAVLQQIADIDPDFMRRINSSISENIPPDMPAGSLDISAFFQVLENYFSQMTSLEHPLIKLSALLNQIAEAIYSTASIRETDGGFLL